MSREGEMAILGKSEKAMTRAMCAVKLIEKRSSQEPTVLVCWVWKKLQID